MGDDGTSWPWCGELDIMEHANSRNYVEGTIHWNAGGSSYNTPYNHKYWGSYSVPAYYYYSDNNNGINGWHTYGAVPLVRQNAGPGSSLFTGGWTTQQDSV